MREQLKQVFASLPPEGIAIHGTTQSRGEEISKTGFNQEINYFCVINPGSNDQPRLLLYATITEIAFPISHALRAVRKPNYSYSNDYKDKIPSLVVFTLPKNYQANEVGLYTDKPIPQEGIIGNISLVGFPSNATFADIITNHLGLALRAAAQTHALLKEKGIINSEGFRRSPPNPTP